MQYTGQFRPLNLMMMPINERACVFNDEFVLADNIDDSGIPINIYADPLAASFLRSPYPFKIQFAMGLLCLGGSMQIRMDLTEYELQPNDVLFVRSGAIGQSLGASSDCKIAVIAFSSDCYRPQMSTQEVLMMHKFLSSGSLLRITEAEMEEVMSIYHTMRRKIQQADYTYKRETLISYMQILFYDCCQAMVPYVCAWEAQPRTRQRQLFDRFIEVLKENYTSQRSISFYAGELCITSKYLSQVVYSVSGRHAGAWIRDYVILEAKALLKSQQYSVQQVSDMLNFANQSFFGVYFKKAVGCSPSAYQNQ